MIVIVIQAGSAAYENTQISYSVLPFGKLWLAHAEMKKSIAVLLGLEGSIDYPELQFTHSSYTGRSGNM